MMNRETVSLSDAIGANIDAIAPHAESASARVRTRLGVVGNELEAMIYSDVYSGQWSASSGQHSALLEDKSKL
ncbi:MAG TPA: hypothetical protein P5307_02895, partial [Pirellulaceae bacterium]|nr:hypothetical protein [Pirellulaceae bacterium]